MPTIQSFGSLGRRHMSMGVIKGTKTREGIDSRISSNKSLRLLTQFPKTLFMSSKKLSFVLARKCPGLAWCQRLWSVSLQFMRLRLHLGPQPQYPTHISRKKPSCISLIIDLLDHLQDLQIPAPCLIWTQSHSYPSSGRPQCIFMMAPYPLLLPLLIYTIGVTPLAIDPSTFAFTTHYSSLLNSTQASPLTRDHPIECVNIPAPNLPTLNPTACREIIPAACEKLSTRFPFLVVRNRWIWTSQAGCSLAYYFPSEAPRSQIPWKEECEQQIYGRIVESCTQNVQEYNGGTINVDFCPNPDGPGRALLHGYPRYLMAPNELDKHPAEEA